MHSRPVYGVPNKDQKREEVIALHAAESHRLESYCEAQEEDGHADAVECPYLVKELRHVSHSVTVQTVRSR